MDSDEFLGLENVEELDDVRLANEALEYFGLASDDINGLWVQRLLVYYFQSRSLWVDSFAWFDVEFVLHYHHYSVRALA